MSVLNENQLLGASGAGGDYEIEQSLRFNDPNSPELVRTFGTATNRKVWTWSGWYKVSLGHGNDSNPIVTTEDGQAQNTLLTFGGHNATNTEKFSVLDWTSSEQFQLVTTALFRDPSAWYHIVVAYDSTQSTSSNRVKIYINGQQVTAFSREVYPPLNYETHLNSAIPTQIGSNDSRAAFFHGYMAETNFIDGQALTPDSFGKTGDYGEWKPIAYAGTYGNNGFYLPFEQDYTVEGFSTVVYEGNGATQYIGGTGFTPDFTWTKGRDRSGSSGSHNLFDAVRGNNARLRSDTTAAEDTGGWIPETDGFTLGTQGESNGNGSSFVAWNWDMGGTTASNTSGSITSSVRANTAYGQSIVRATYSGSGTQTFGHGLGVAPDLILGKAEDHAYGWGVYHSGLSSPETKSLALNTTAAATTNNMWANTLPTSSVFSTTIGGLEDAGYPVIFYCFSSIANYSKFGSYSGNGSSTGPVITLGFSPAFVMIKRTDSATSWFIHDNVRDPSNPNTAILKPNSNSAEFNGTAVSVDFLSTGFQLKNTDASFNASGGTYIYAAFADTREYAYWYDQSGNNNDWTSEGGLTESDVMVDSPTNNFATMSEIASTTAAGYTSTTYSEGNLEIKSTSGVNAARSPFRMQGKSYFEACIVNLAYQVVGFGSMGWDGQQNIASGFAALNVYPNAGAEYLAYNVGGSKVDVGPNAFSSAALTVFGFAYDETSGKAWVSVNGTWYGSGNPATGANPAVTFNANLRNNIFPSGAGHPNGSPSGSPLVFNFGADSSFAGNKTPQGNQDGNDIGDFYYAPPTGFLALCTKNLPDATVIPSEHFNTVLYTGDATYPRAIIDVGFQPDFTWVKGRSSAYSHSLYDVVRGTGITKSLYSNVTNAEGAFSANQNLASFDSDGFSIGATSSTNTLNVSGQLFASWNWKAGGAASSNTNGSITSSVSANPSAGFSIVSWVGTNTTGSVGHSLSQIPELIISKSRTVVGDWIVATTVIDGSMDYSRLNTTNAFATLGVTASTASVFYTASGALNRGDMIAYAFHSVDGHSKVGSYEANNSTDGPFVNLGFKPAFVMIKPADVAADWFMFDNKRDIDNAVAGNIYANSSSAESQADSLDFLSNGFKLRNAGSGGVNNSGTYIFLAFAETPFKFSNAR